MRDRFEVGRAIDKILIPYADCFAGEELGAAGSSCYDPNDFASAVEKVEAACTLAAVQLEMEKYGTRHTDLAKKVAAQTKNQYVTYPWLRDAVARLLSSTNYEKLWSMVVLSRKVRWGMKIKGLTQININSVKEVLK